MLETGMFVTTKCSRYVDYGIKKGDLVYLAGETMVVVEEKDPYNYRKLFIGAYTNDGHVDAVRKPLTLDGINLKAVSSTKQAELVTMMQEDFKQEEVDSESID